MGGSSPHVPQTPQLSVVQGGEGCPLGGWAPPPAPGRPPLLSRATSDSPHPRPGAGAGFSGGGSGRGLPDLPRERPAGGRGGAGGARVGAPLAGTGSRAERAFVLSCRGALDGNFLSPEGQRPRLWVAGPEPTLPSSLGRGGRVAGQTRTRSHSPLTMGRGHRQTRRSPGGRTSRRLLRAETLGQACAPCAWAGTVHTPCHAQLRRVPPCKPTGTRVTTCETASRSCGLGPRCPHRTGKGLLPQRHPAGQRPGVTQMGTLGPRTRWGAGRRPRQRPRLGWEGVGGAHRGQGPGEAVGARPGQGGRGQGSRPASRACSLLLVQGGGCWWLGLLLWGSGVGWGAREGQGGAPSGHRPPASANNLRPRGPGLGLAVGRPHCDLTGPAGAASVLVTSSC